jgi:GNAT superfamily N-acetyltransferase
MSINTLPDHWTLVNPTPADLTRVTNFVRACDIAFFGEPDTSEADMEYEWNRSGFDVRRYAWLLIDPSNEIAGYTDFYQHDSDLYINHNTAFLPGKADPIPKDLFYRMGMQRGKENLQPGGRIRTISLREETSRMLEELGFHAIQVQYRMQIDFTGPPDKPEWPAGYQLTPFNRDKHAREVYEVIETAFQELPHREGNSFEGWGHFVLERSDFDPAFLFMITKDEEVAGVAIGFNNPMGGWVKQLAVKKSHRGQHLALNLLRHAFTVFYEQGCSLVALTVDSENATGAPQLYLRAGMKQIEKYVTYVKEV